MPQPVSDEKSGENLPQYVSKALVALGSNLPVGDVDVTETVARAADEIGRTLGVIRGLSRFYRTPAFPVGSGPDFVNAALALDTKLSPSQVLAGLHGIEEQFGRERGNRWGARTLDLDLLAFDDTVLPDMQTYCDWAALPLDQQMQRAPDRLVLPHPRLAERGFVLVPLNDVAPDWCHPVTGNTVSEMLNALPADSISDVVAL